jgi:hypothetical protein
MYQVTIVSKGEEIGYGEGDSAAYAKEEALASLDGMGHEYMTAFGYQMTISTTIDYPAEHTA